MDLLDAIRRRHTTNGAFADRPVDPEDKRRLLEMAARAPSHFNSQPWRFVVVEDEERRKTLGQIAGDSMRHLIEEGAFWQQYKRYFRFSKEEVEATKDGILIDNMPAVLKPFIKYLFTEQGGKMMNALQVPRVLANDARKLVERSPLILGIALTRGEYKPGELAGLYSMVSLGAVVQTIWLTATSLGMGFQFISTPQEVPANWERVSAVLGIPAEYELMLLIRLGYIDPQVKRPAIDWTSPQRKGIAELVFQETWGNSLDNERLTTTDEHSS
jgi:nitroreductase